ncbi:MAG: PAS domain-containing protein [Thalassobaculaceae bacterium]|nr:PAS domain-containing protein [Thalassobaculaceae bacterium]
MGKPLAVVPVEIFDRFISIFQTHRKTLRPATITAILRDENQEDILDWLTVVARTPSTYRILLSGAKISRVAGESLAGKTIDMLPPNRAGHLRRIYDRMLAAGKATQTRCVYRFTNGKEAIVDTLVIPIPDAGDAGVIYIVSAPHFTKATWLAEIVSGSSDALTKPNAIVGLSERALDLV